MKLKLRKIGNSLGVLLPKVITKELKNGDFIDLGVITTEDIPQVITEKKQEVITDENSTATTIATNAGQWCSKHDTYKGTCGCK